MSKVKITKAKLKHTKKGDINLEVEYEQTLDGGKQSVSQLCTVQPHDDLRKAFRLLDPHLGALCEQFAKDGKIDTDGIRARGFSVKDEDDETKDGITITGGRTLSNGKVITLNSPFAKWNGLEEHYPGASDLDKAVNQCTNEVSEYLFNGKHAPDDQGKLFDEEAEN